MRNLFIVLALLALGFTSANAAPAAPMSPEQKAAIEDLIKNYLTKDHPEVVVDAIKEMQRRDQAEAEAKTTESIKANKAKIYEDPNTPVFGNPKGDVTIVEFGDYQCGYCKMSEPFLEKILKDDKGVRIVYKDFPVLGPASTTASKAALAVFRQGGSDKYMKMHDDLFGRKEHLTDDMIYQAAKDAGADVEKVKKDMNDDAMQKQIQSNLDLGISIGVRGTPMFIINDKAYPGALQYDQLKKAIDDARAGATKKG